MRVIFPPDAVTGKLYHDFGIPDANGSPSRHSAWLADFDALHIRKAHAGDTRRQNIQSVCAEKVMSAMGRLPTLRDFDALLRPWWMLG